ncbi:hypothetical protein VTI74DRAFT_11479 [Chaetomium olivicolor]
MATRIIHDNYHVTRGSPPKRHSLDLPIEIHRQIYGLASSKISADARPSIYRTFRLCGGNPVRALNRLGNSLHHVCECSRSSSLATARGDTRPLQSSLYATYDPDAALTTRYTDRWTETVGRLISLSGNVLLTAAIRLAGITVPDPVAGDQLPRVVKLVSTDRPLLGQHQKVMLRAVLRGDERFKLPPILLGLCRT